MRVTKKQRKVLEAICEGIRDTNNVRVGWLDVQMICDRVDYEVSMHSMKFTVRFLIQKGLAKKGDAVLRRERWVIPIIPEDVAFDIIYRKTDARIVEHDDVVVEEFW